MSTGAECDFIEKKPGKWYYELQQWPYGETEDYDTFGPFPTFRAAYKHLNKNHANPGGFSTEALPGCKHDLLRKNEFPQGSYTHSCDRCGEPVKRDAAARLVAAGVKELPPETD